MIKPNTLQLSPTQTTTAQLKHNKNHPNQVTALAQSTICKPHNFIQSSLKLQCKIKQQRNKTPSKSLKKDKENSPSPYLKNSKKEAINLQMIIDEKRKQIKNQQIRSEQPKTDIVVDQRDHLGLNYHVLQRASASEQAHRKSCCLGELPYIPYSLVTLKSKIEQNFKKNT